MPIVNAGDLLSLLQDRQARDLTPDFRRETQLSQIHTSNSSSTER